MPLSLSSKSMCVLYALLFSLTLSQAAVAQGYNEAPYRSHQQSGGLVDRLSSGQIAKRSVREEYSGAYQSSLRPERSNVLDNPFGSQQVERAIALRPEPMSVRQASYEPVEQESGFIAAERNQAQSRQDLNRLNAQEHLQSFIERENTEPVQAKANATDMITRIGVNLVFVLALAVGGILLVKQIQKGRVGGVSGPPADLAGLKIDQVLQVTRGVSLYLVDSTASKILVAVDGGGIKSVNVLPGRFEDELDEPEAFSRNRESVTDRNADDAVGRQSSRRRVNKASTSDIDDNLIKLLLSKSKEAA